MKRAFTDAADQLNRTVTSKEQEVTAHNYGQGNPEAILDAGLMARNNAAHTLIEFIKTRKEQRKRIEDLIYDQIRKTLDDINAEMDWLENQIKAEEKAIQQNNAEIDFIRTLHQDNLTDANGELRQDVKYILKKYGHDNLDGKDPDEIMHLLGIIETDLHGDNIERVGRIEAYQDRHSDLRDIAGDMLNNLPDNAPEDFYDQVEETAARQAYEVNYRAMKEAQTEALVNTIAEAEITNTANAISSTFKPF